MTITKYLVILMCLVPKMAIAQPEGWTPHRMMQYERLVDAVISPDGMQVACTIATPRMGGSESRYLYHVYTVAVDNGKLRPMSDGENSCYSPAFSPDGTTLSYISEQKGDDASQVYIISLPGEEPHRVTNAPGGIDSYAWSPDGTRIAYTSADTTPDDRRRAIREKRDSYAYNSILRYKRLYVVDIDGGDALRLTPGEYHIDDFYASDPPFSWSPDGRTIVFQHQQGPSVDLWCTNDISSVSADGGAIKPLVRFNGFDKTPRHSPTGKHIAFLSDDGDPHWAFRSYIYVMSPDGSNMRKLAPTPDSNIMRLIGWSPNSNEIYFEETDGTTRRLYVIPVDGGSPRSLTSGEGTFSDVSFSRDGKFMAFIHQTSEMPPEIWASPTDTFRPVRLTHIHDEYNTMPLGKTEVIRWQSPDGREVEGLLTYPVGYEKGRKYPLVLDIHGGPMSVHTQTYTARADKFPIQAFAQAGYAILRPNPRGSRGYGKEHRFANYNDWGGGDFEDDIAGVNTVIGMGVAHPDSLCVRGWSYGGFMTAVTVTKTDRFKAAVMGAGISDLISYTGTNDIPSFVPDYFDGDPWERRETYIAHSPIFAVGNVTTPLLILHGTEDARVPVTQGIEFYNGLTRQGKTCELILYPRSRHSPTEPKLIEDAGQRTLNWMNQWLRGTSDMP